MLYSCFWVIPRRHNLMCRRFGTLCQFHLHRSFKLEYPGHFVPVILLVKTTYEDGTECSETSAHKNSDYGYSPKRKNTADMFFYALLSAFRERHQKLRNRFCKISHCTTQLSSSNVLQHVSNVSVHLQWIRCGTPRGIPSLLPFPPLPL